MPHLPLMQWDYRDQLQATSQQVRTDGGTPETTYYVYDAAGQRVRKVTERQNETRKDERAYLGGFEVYRTYDGSGTGVILERETLHVMDDQQRIALVETKTMDNGGQINAPTPAQRFQCGNHLGSASLELDDQAQIISYEEYYPYGSTSYQAGRSAAEVSLKRYRYTGKERDEETRFSYHGVRYYAPWLGRWISCDPSGLRDGINIYAHVRQNPLGLIDPEGTESKKAPPEVVEKLVTEVKAYYNQMLDIAEDSLKKSGGIHWRDPMKVGTLAGRLMQEDLESILGKGNFEAKIVDAKLDISLKEIPVDIELKKTDKAKRSKQDFALKRHAQENKRLLVYVMGDIPDEIKEGKLTKGQIIPPEYHNYMTKGFTKSQLSRLEAMTSSIRDKVSALSGKGSPRRGLSGGLRNMASDAGIGALVGTVITIGIKLLTEGELPSGKEVVKGAVEGAVPLADLAQAKNHDDTVVPILLHFLQRSLARLAARVAPKLAPLLPVAGAAVGLGYGLPQASGRSMAGHMLGAKGGYNNLVCYYPAMDPRCGGK